jgi:hypothetical protein
MTRLHYRQSLGLHLKRGLGPGPEALCSTCFKSGCCAADRTALTLSSERLTQPPQCSQVERKALTAVSAAPHTQHHFHAT